MKLTNYIKSLITKTKQNDKHIHTYIFLVAVRFLLVLIPQTGYIHPDEFFQSVEVLLGDQFQLEHTRTWEFNNTFPIRSMAIPYFMIKVPLSFLEFIAVYTKFYLNWELRNSYIFLVYPRLIVCLLSFVNDWSIYKICESYNLRYEIRLLALGSSFIMLIFGTRTFSNTIEMAICSLLLYFVADCMIQSNTVIYKTEFLHDRYQKASSTGERVKIWKLKMGLPAHSYNRTILMATLCVIGVFNRPTFIIFGAPMVFFWLLRGMGTKLVTFTDFNIRVFLFCISAVPLICFFILVDSLYYKYLTNGEILMFDIGMHSFVVTPLNFVKYNIDPQKTAEHGIHSKYLHLFVNIPMLYNVLGVVAICSFSILLYNFLKGEYKNLPRSQSIVGLMSSAIFVPLSIFSLINHQEPRFLIPLTLPIILLHSPKLITGFCPYYPFKIEHKFLRYIYHNFLCTAISSKYLLKTWYTLNIFLTIFFGFVHQGGVIQLAQHFSDQLSAKPINVNVHLVTSHIYNMPMSLINIPRTKNVHSNHLTEMKYHRNKDFYLYEYGGMELNKLMQKIKLIIDVNEMRLVQKKQKYKLFLAIPTSLGEDLNDAFNLYNTSVIKYELKKVFYPHLSTEAMPKPNGRHPCDINTNESDLIGTCEVDPSEYYSISNVIKQFSSVVHQFGLALYKFDVVKITKNYATNVHKENSKKQ